MQKVVVIGSPGAGKSTLSRKLSRQLKLPLYHMDQLFWRPGWVSTPKAEFLAELDRITQSPQWIIDGNYNSTLALRIAAADTIVFLDLQAGICFRRVIRRSLQNRRREDMTEGCSEQFLSKDYWEFLLFVLTFRRHSRPKILRLIGQHRTGKRVCHLLSPAQVDNFISTL